MKQLLNTRSPLWACLYIVVFLVAVIAITLPEDRPAKSLVVAVAMLLFVGVSVPYYGRLFRHNKRNKKYPVKYIGMVPLELKDEDEGMQLLTARATRKVYIYYSYIMPLAALTCALLKPSSLFVVIGIGALMLGQVIIYWLSMWSVYGDNE